MNLVLLSGISSEPASLLLLGLLLYALASFTRRKPIPVLHPTATAAAGSVAIGLVDGASIA